MHEEEDGSEANSCSASRIVASRSVDVAEVEGAKEQACKLCGYLNKLSGKGPLRGYKPRWFVYDPRKCYLYYFKTPQDALPLGHIEIGDASFSYEVEVEEGQFEIRTAGKEFLLKVGNFSACGAQELTVFCCHLSLPLSLWKGRHTHSDLTDLVFRVLLLVLNISADTHT